jgi:hypothetical protein
VGRGILYGAVGAEYFAEAVISARSSLRHNDLPHVVFTDADRDAGHGIEVRVVEPSENPYADKIRSMLASPFERTIYLDSDTYVLDDLSDLYALLDRFDLAACHSPGYRGLSDPDVPASFYELNTGLVAWRREPETTAFLEDWLATYERWSREPPFPHAGDPGGYADQPAFRHCMWTHRLRLCVVGHEYCLRTPQCAQVADRVRVIHGRHEDFERVALIANRERRARIFPRGTFEGM